MIKWVIILAVVLAVLYYLFPIVRIYGVSMYPTYKEGDIIIATRIFRKSKLKVGDVVLYHAPNDRKRVVIKRISEIGKRHMYCLGDNADESYDSRGYGYVPLSRLVCKPVKHREKIESEVTR